MLKKLEQWKQDLNDLEKELNKCEGALEQSMANLQEAGYETLEEAEIAYAKLQEKKAALRAEATELTDRLKEKYADYVE